MFCVQAPYNAAAYAVTVTFATTTNSVLYAWSFFTWRLVFKTVRFVVSLYVLYELRHPSVFPDEKTKFKKASNASGDETGEIKKAAGPNEAAPNGDGRRVGDVNDPANKAAHVNDGKEIGVGSKKSGPAAVSSESPGRKKSKAELEAEAERERRRAARAMKKAERKKQKEAEDAAKRARVEGADVIDNRPLAPLNALFRIPSKAYRVL